MLQNAFLPQTLWRAYSTTTDPYSWCQGFAAPLQGARWLPPSSKPHPALCLRPRISTLEARAVFLGRGPTPPPHSMQNAVNFTYFLTRKRVLQTDRQKINRQQRASLYTAWRRFSGIPLGTGVCLF